VFRGGKRTLFFAGGQGKGIGNSTDGGGEITATLEISE